ncbi:MAG TPA: BatA domain-containing protein, partial [Candidatus Eisenbacteria bacterium]|nr:BatA domain-containing protein [Candidatus Eisenbacteria bacterium]
MNFLNPLFLSALAAAAIPILIHLFTRRRPREVRFSSLEFLAEVNQSEIRRLKLKQWLLLLLRTLAVAALALAMARPALRGGAGGSAASTLVALVDVSGSMGAPDAAGRPLTDDARRVVESLLATLAPADELLLVPYDRAPRPVSARPLGDAARLRAAAQALAPTASTTDHRAALALAGRALAESHALNRELFWISDFQRAGFADAAAGGAVSEPLRAPPGPWGATRVYLVPLAPRSRANVALARLTPVPAGATSESADSAAEGGLALEVAASAYDASPEGGAATRDVAVEVRALGEDAGAAGADPVLGRGFVSLPARGDGSTLVPLARVPGAGGEVLLPDDALALDNLRVFAAGHAGALHVLLREDGPPSPLRLALAAGAPAAGLGLRAVDAVTLAR